MEWTCRGDDADGERQIAEWIGPHQIFLMYTYSFRDLSCKLGPYLAQKLRQGEQWAEAFVAQMKQRIEPPSDQPWEDANQQQDWLARPYERQEEVG